MTAKPVCVVELRPLRGEGRPVEECSPAKVADALRRIRPDQGWISFEVHRHGDGRMEFLLAGKHRPTVNRLATVFRGLRGALHACPGRPFTGTVPANQRAVAYLKPRRTHQVPIRTDVKHLVRDAAGDPVLELLEALEQLPKNVCAIVQFVFRKRRAFSFGSADVCPPMSFGALDGEAMGRKKTSHGRFRVHARVLLLAKRGVPRDCMDILRDALAASDLVQGNELRLRRRRDRKGRLTAKILAREPGSPRSLLGSRRHLVWSPEELATWVRIPPAAIRLPERAYAPRGSSGGGRIGDGAR